MKARITRVENLLNYQRVINLVKDMCLGSTQPVYISSEYLFQQHKVVYAFMPTLVEFKLIERIGTGRRDCNYTWIGGDVKITDCLVYKVYMRAREITNKAPSLTKVYNYFINKAKQQGKTMAAITKEENLKRYKSMLDTLKEELVGGKQITLNGKIIGERFGIAAGELLKVMVKMKILSQHGSVFPYSYTWIHPNGITDNFVEKLWSNTMEANYVRRSKAPGFKAPNYRVQRSTVTTVKVAKTRAQFVAEVKSTDNQPEVIKPQQVVQPAAKGTAPTSPWLHYSLRQLSVISGLKAENGCFTIRDQDQTQTFRNVVSVEIDTEVNSVQFKITTKTNVFSFAFKCKHITMLRNKELIVEING